ncbi:MAG TPA: metallophosphoesterase [Acidobacteriota bacterium]|nr:metallophosphoesterase [Acidobacteriota bacterium]
MFLLNELILSSPLAIYTYIRVLRLFSRNAARFLFTAGFVVLLAGFPVAETLSHRGAGGLAKVVMIAGYDALPLLLYLILTVILSDLAIAAARLLKILSREAVRRPRFRRFRLAAALIIPALVVAAGIANYHHLRVREYTIEVPRRSSSAKELTIAFAADFHLGTITAGRFMERFVAKVNAASPDIVLIGGDILEGDRRDEATGKFEAQFRRLQPKYGVYAVPGNHEGHGGDRTDFFERAGIRLLEDVVVKIDDAVYLAGRNDAHSRNRKPVAGLLRDTPGDLPVILLDHRPTDLENISRTGADIQLSGHTHHGQLFPINWITNREYELSWGHIKKNRTHVFVTSGVQLWGPPVRTAGSSEILLLHVLFKESAGGNRIP